MSFKKDFGKLKKKWEEYKQHLQEKYPPEEGESWVFTCSTHQEIDDQILEIDDMLSGDNYEN
jgi:hypothetical protein